MIDNFEILKNEIKTFAKFKLLWIGILIINIFMIVGINSINLSNEMSLHNIKMTSMTSAFGSAKYGALSGTLAFSLFTIFILSRDEIKRIKPIIYSAADEQKLLIIRTFSIIFYVIIAVISGMIFTMAFQMIVYKVSVHFLDYLYCYVLIVFSSLTFSVLMSTGIYLVSESTDISILFMLALFFVGFLSSNYMLNWVQTGVMVFSDFGGIRPASKLILYNRLLWLGISISILLTGFLFRRRYETFILKSFVYNAKSKILILCTVVTVCVSVLIYAKEPYTMNWYPSDNFTINKNVKLKKLHPEIKFYDDKETLSGEVLYEFENNDSDFVQFSVNEGLKIKSIEVNGKPCSYKKTGKTHNIEIAIPKTKDVKVTICYEGKIKYYKGGASAGYICKDSIYLLEQSNWIFEPLTENEKIIDINGYYSAPDDLLVVTPGKITNIESKKGNKIWHFNFKSKNINIGAFAAKYKKSEFNVDGIDVNFYYSPKHEAYIKNMNIEKYIRDMFQYYSHNIGEYYSKEYPLNIAETSIYKTGGHSSGNVITFAEYMINRENGSFMKEPYILIHDLDIIAHEMAHQWWGTGVNITSEGGFSDEGFAEYSSYKYMQKEFENSSYNGLANLQADLWQQEVNSLDKSYYLSGNENLEKLNKNIREKFENQKLKIQRYDVMPLRLKQEEELLGGKIFLKKLSDVYKNNVSKNLSYEEFLHEMGITKEVFPCD